MNLKTLTIVFIIVNSIALIKCQRKTNKKYDPEVYYKLLKNIFVIPDAFDDLFIKGSVYITKPEKATEWKNIIETREAEAIGMLRNTKKLVQIRFVPANKIASSYSYVKNRITCNFKKEEIDKSHSLPTEHKVSSVVNGDHSSFLQYYGDKSLQIKKNRKNPAVTVFVNDWHNSTLLDEWIDKESKVDLKTYEKKLKNIFKKVYDALEELEKVGFTYTDLSPYNIRVNSTDDPYLVNLGSVIQANKNTHVCVSNEKFHPPDLLDKNYYSGIEIKMNDYLERLKTWMFCFNVYHSFCQIDMNPKEFSAWISDKKKKDFMSYFGCKDRHPSKEFNHLVNTCLTKSMKGMPKFESLKKEKWLKV